MATVYLARDLKHDRRVAIKVLRPELAAALGPDRFPREIRIVAQLQHPHVLPLHDSGERDGFLYYVMPFVEGESLRTKLDREGQLPIHDAVRILREVVDALSHAHAHGVLHRDIKPDNVMLSGRHAMVMDFGVAKAVSNAGGEALTTVGVAVGTPQYMSPEQATGEVNVDHRSDVYSIGTLAYELLTGEPPFTGKTAQAILSAQVLEKPKPVTDIRPSVPAPLVALIDRCLEKNPADRWQSAEEILKELEAIATPSGGITPTTTRPVKAVAPAAAPVAAQRGFPRWAIGAIAAVVIAAAAFGGWKMLAGGPPGPERMAVMPVQDLSGKDGVFVDAMQDQLITALGQVPGARVSPRSAVVRYRSEPEPAEKVARDARRRRHRREHRLSRRRPHAHQRTARRPPLHPPALEPELRARRQRRARGPGLRRQADRRRDHPGRRSPNHRFPMNAPRLVAFGLVALSTLASCAGEKPAVGITATVLVPGSELAEQPALSPDARRIAYSAPVDGAGAIWVRNADGSNPVRLTHGVWDDMPIWSPDGKWIAYGANDPSFDVWVVSSDGGEPRALAADAESEQPFAWTPDGAGVVYMRYGATVETWVASLADGSKRPLLSVDGGYYAEPAPTGGRIAYQLLKGGTSMLWVLDSANAVPRQLTTEGREGIRQGHAFSPDGTLLLYESRRTGTSDLWVVNVATGETRQLTSDVQDDYQGRWSPDGKWVAFLSQRGGQLDVWVMSAAGGPAVRLTDDRATEADISWASDGSAVAFTSVPGVAQVRRISADGGVPALLSFPDYNSGDPHVSPDGNSVAFVSDRSGNSDVWVVPTAGGDPRPLTTSALGDDDPDWSPDGREIVFASQRGKLGHLGDAGRRG